MNEQDPCQGCRHLRTYTCPFQRPTCDLRANFGDIRCRRETWPQATRPDRSTLPTHKGGGFVGPRRPRGTA